MFRLNEVKYKNILDIKEMTINNKQITCIIGQSGSGKTTLLRLLNKLITCDSGQITYQNQPFDQIHPIDLRRSVVMLSQTPAIYKGTIKDNLLIGLRFSEKPLASDSSLKDIMKLIKLNKELHEDADKLSGGEKQRLCLGRILLMEPEVLLLDEPSSALDEDTEQKVIEEVVNYTRDKNKTLIMVTHSKTVAREYADVTIEIEKGMVINRKEAAL